VEGALLLRKTAGPGTLPDVPKAPGGLEDRFLHFLLSFPLQGQVAPLNWMIPVRDDAPRLPSLSQIPRARKGRVVTPTSVAEVHAALEEWEAFLRDSRE